jgi:cytochrome c556
MLLAAIASSVLARADEPAVDVIAARQALMVAAENLMQSIDTYTVDDSIDPETMRTHADAIAAMLLALPHLFPANTNSYDPAAEFPETLALPAVWENFAGFYAMASVAAAAAAQLAETFDPDALATASLGLRASCDACHSLYLLPYEPPTVTQEELDFDFDSIFDQK